MRRRQAAGVAGAPERLLRFSAEDWAGVGCHPECAYYEAIGAWREAHPDAPPSEWVTRGPDTPFHPELI